MGVMSPITHGLIGWAVSRPLKRKQDRMLVTLAALVPDIDGLTLLGGVDLYHEYHHTFGHNVFLAVAFSSLAFLSGEERKKTFFLAFLSFHLHLVCDLLGSGADWGIFYLWPVSRMEITSFPPFQWALGSWQNLVVTIGILFQVCRTGVREGRTVLELVSEKADKEFVGILRKWARSPGP